MRRLASRVLVLVPRRVEQAVEAMEAEVQVLRRLARLLMRAMGAVPLAGKVAPGAVPVVGSARLRAVLTAFARPVVFVLEAEMLPPGRGIARVPRPWRQL